MSARVEEKPDGAPEWMVSYADMITIIMSFFVIMFALATGKNEGKKAAAMDSIEYRFGPQWRPFKPIVSVGPVKAASLHKGNKGPGKGNPDRMVVVEDDDPSEALQLGRANIMSRGSLAAIGGAVYFEENSTEPDSVQLARLRLIAKACAGKLQKIEVLGLACARPLPADSPYHDHWDLAYARARRVMELLIAQGIDARRVRLSVAGDTEPVSGRGAVDYVRRNSRVDIYLTDVLMSEAEESARDGK
jgi:chemotaxis protein MotB